VLLLEVAVTPVNAIRDEGWGERGTCSHRVQSFGNAGGRFDSEGWELRRVGRCKRTVRFRVKLISILSKDYK